MAHAQTPKTPTASELRAWVEEARPESKFFTRKNMAHSGDTMRNYGVSGPVEVSTHSGDKVLCWELFRRRPVLHGLHSPAYFCCKTFRQVHKAI